MLDWFTQAGRGLSSNAGIWYLYRQQNEARQAGLRTARPGRLSVMARRLGIRPATLRGLGPDQLLVLVNGKRRHQQALVNVQQTIGGMITAIVTAGLWDGCKSVSMNQVAQIAGLS